MLNNTLQQAKMHKIRSITLLFTFLYITLHNMEETDAFKSNEAHQGALKNDLSSELHEKKEDNIETKDQVIDVIKELTKFENASKNTESSNSDENDTSKSKFESSIEQNTTEIIVVTDILLNESNPIRRNSADVKNKSSTLPTTTPSKSTISRRVKDHLVDTPEDAVIDSEGVKREKTQDEIESKKKYNHASLLDLNKSFLYILSVMIVTHLKTYL